MLRELVPFIGIPLGLLLQAVLALKLDLPGCHSQHDTRKDALANLYEDIGLWLEVEAKESGVNRSSSRS